MKSISDNIKSIIALIVVISAFSYFFIVAFTGIKADNQVLIAIVGTLGIVIGYYFGTSQGSQKKDEIIQELKNNNDK